MRNVLVVIVFMLCSFIVSVAYASGISYKEGAQGKAVAEIQSRLRTLGYAVERIDGRYSKSTGNTVKMFQKKQGLKETGVVDGSTYAALFGSKDTAKEKPSNSILANRITITAIKYMGVPYKFGGITPKGFDCSGFVWYVFNQQGKSLPRAADVQYKAGKPIFSNELRRGDLVFFTTYEPGASHCGIYLESGKFIHASSSKGVMISKLEDYYWKPRYLGARRVI
jgi:cell wall-associated NlpC family hydrolase